MSDLTGRLSVFEPIAILQMLHHARLTGRLDLISEDNRAKIFFEEGDIAFADLKNRPDRLGDVLLNQGAVDREALEAVLKNGKGGGKKLGRRLVESGIVSPEAIRGAVESQIQEVVYLAVRWREGTFKFKAGATPKDEDVKNELPLDHLMLEGVRRMDEEDAG